MKLNTLRSVTLLSLVCAALSANAVVIDFEDLAANTNVGSSYAGLTFTNAVVLQSPNYNYLNFPPHSGTNVAYNESDPITIAFATATNSVGLWYSAGSPVTLTAYNGANVLGTVGGASVLNATSFISFAGPGITSITISSGSSNSLTIDDLTYNVSSVPAPAAAASFALIALRRRRKA